ncbi:BON domain-containing protein (plasmid) [Ralstonia syzygii]|uniref:BON domain-containing protein n=1 Tax=Ralstonia syzygii TaxID=28097 RepID=A0ABX7ZKS7_9RALS|nr:BON domain-containing protein [Ralstonia syzygii]QUP56062.1 BON domain-containing protein [Ralstonia syzygii]
MFVEAKNAEGAVAGGKSRPGLSQSLARPARRICAHCLKLAICAAMPVAFAQMPSASGPSGVPGRDLRNGVNDPFIQISKDVPDCPVPHGSFLTEAQMRSQSHDRIERGNSCYHAGLCRHASAHASDPEIADAAQKRLHNDPRLRDSALWITVQRRFITLQGCAASARQIDYVAEVLRQLPDVQHVTVDVGVRRPSAPVMDR